MKTLPWFRMYHESLDDEKLRLLAFEDRWHFVALLCCKAKGILDDGSIDLIRRKVAVKLGLAIRELDEVARRLDEVDLIDKDTLQPLAWDSRQCQSDKDETNAQRQQRYRDAHKAPVTPRNALRNAPVTGIDTEEEEEEDKDKEKTHAIPKELLADFLVVRKAKKAGALTNTAIKGIQREADKAGLTLIEAVTVCCELGWQGFNANWYAERQAKSLKTKPAETFAERDARNARKRWEAMTGMVHPDNIPNHMEVFDADHLMLGVSQ